MSEPKRVLAYPGQCRNCMKKRPVVSIQRYGGGTYRRPGRWYRTSICRECVEQQAPYAAQVTHAGGTTSRYGAREILELAAAEWQEG